MVVHYIQKHILDALRKADAMRYAQLIPNGVESSHFRYHLKQLIQDKHVEPVSRGQYRLTLDGQRAVDKLSERRIRPSPMPKVITYTLLQDGSTIILQRKQKQPYMHLLNMIGGKVHEGETTAEASVREVQEKTNTTITNPRLAGIFEVRISHGGALLTHAIAYTYIAQVKATDYAAPSLVAIPASELKDTPDLAPDFLAIFAKVHNTPGIQVDMLDITI